MVAEQLAWSEMDEAVFGLPEAALDDGDGWGPLEAAELGRIRFLAEHPEYADPLLSGVRSRKWTAEDEAVFLRKFVEGLRRAGRR